MSLRPDRARLPGAARPRFRRALRLALALMTAAAFRGGAPVAAAPLCGAGTQRWVAVSLGPGLGRWFTPDDYFGALAAALRERALETCAADEPAASEPIAEIDLFAGAQDAVVLRIRINTPSGAQPVERALSLETLPRDGRALALAVSTDELLRARLEGRPAPEPQAAPPSEGATAALKARPASSEASGANGAERPERLVLGAFAAALASQGGERQGGVELRAGTRVGPLELFARGALRRSLPRDSARGDAEVATRAASAGLGLLYWLGPRGGRFGLRLGAVVDHVWLAFDATAPAAGVVTSNASGRALLAGALAQGALRLSPRLALVAALGLHQTLREAAALESTPVPGGRLITTVTALGGVGVELGLGFELRL